VGFTGSAIWGPSASQTTITQNTYYNGGFLYGSTGPASYYQQLSGAHIWYNAPSGTGGTGATFTQRMTLDASGNLLVGTTSATSGYNIIGSQSVDGNAGIMAINTSNTTSATAVMRYKNSGSTSAYTGLGSPSRAAYAGLGANVLAMYTDSTAGITFLVDAAGSIRLNTNAIQRMEIDSGGIVSMSIYGAGAATFSAGGVISSVSDETWKTKDGVPTNPDAMLQKLEPGYWFYNEEKAPTFGADRQLGFYAQNVHEAIGSEAAPTPETYKDKDGNDVTKPWGYYDRSVLAIAVMSLKNALNTIEELKQRIETLENK
jgi:hypothetical protein